MAARIKEKVVPVQAFVHSQFVKKDGPAGEEHEGEVNGKDEFLSVQKFVTEPARVQVDYGLTINLGNYESARIGVAISVPCYFEEIDQAYKWASKWVEARIKTEHDAIRKTLRESVEDQF